MQDGIEATVDDISRTGELPSGVTLEERFPGITTSQYSRKEVYMGIIFTLRMRGFKVTEVARALRLSEASVHTYIGHIRKNLEREMLRISFAGVIGRSMAVYRELQNQSNKLIFAKDTDTRNKLTAIGHSMRLEQSQLGLLKSAGFFDNTKLQPSFSTEQPANQLQTMQEMLLKALRGDETIIDNELDGEATNELTHVVESDNVTLLGI